MTKGTLIGAPIVGIKVDLNDGSYHDVDSSDMAFKICSIAAFKQAYAQARPTILEPLMKIEITVPTEFQGSITGQISQRRGIISGSQQNQEAFTTIEAEVPLAEMFGYATELRSATQGKGEFTMEFSRYNPVPRGVQEELIKKFEKEQAEKAKG